MKFRKKLLALTMMAALGFSVTACTNNGKQEVTQEATESTSAGYRSDVSCAELEAAVADVLGDNYWPQTEFPGVEDLGITADMYEDYIYKVPMISTNVDTLIIVKASQGHLEDVKKALNTYRDNLIGDTLQYPMNIPKIQNSVIAEYGDYVAFIQLGAEEAMLASDEAVAKNETISDDELSGIEAAAIAEQNSLAAAAIEAALKAE
jgi:hypothetical protein